ncbi:acid protease [Phellopilus nigrolimitatus]|nr:acid protease [Phellopilus nigrolimitatus]
MQLVLSFSTLLASLLVALSLANDAAARPLKRNAGMVTLPMKRISQARNDVHPQLLLQQHINRGAKRLARMAGRAGPTDLEMRDKLHKRMYLLPGSRKPEKRFNRQGMKPISAAVTNNAKVETLASSTDGGQGISLSGLLSALGLTGAGSQDAAKQRQKGNGAAGTATASAAGASASNSTSGGISQVDINDAANGGLTPANNPTANNSIGLQIEANDVGYIATVQMGTPPADFKLLMDSGSADLWVGGENCQSESGGGCGNHTFLGNTSSSSFVDSGQPFEVTYGSGDVKGTIINDNLNVAGLNLQNHTFGVATQESVDFSADTTTFDGLMGLAQSTLSEQKVLTPVESLAKAGSISSAITSFKLGRVADNNNDGEVTFGGLDETKFDKTTLTTIDNVSQTGFWEGAMNAVSVNGKDLGLKGRTAILDTGTTLIIAPQADADAVHAAIPGSKPDGQGGYTIPCTTTASVALNFGNTNFAIDPRDLLFSAVDPNNPTGDCVSGISAGQVGGANEWLCGDVFLKNAYFSTDVNNNKISLAKLV